MARNLARPDPRARRQGVKSPEGRSIALQLLDAPKEQRRTFLHALELAELNKVFQEVERETGTMYALWHDDPMGFVQDVLGETQWGLQAEVTDAIALPGVKRIVVPAGFGVGKTYLAGRMVAWAGATNPIGTIRIVTTATRLRQVVSQLWPHIKTAVAKGNLPGQTDTIQWTANDMYGNRVQIAYGFSAPANDEAAMQGIHGTPKLLLVVDEAGGIAPMIGKGTNNLLTGDAKLLAIGNPAMNEPGSWFEKLTEKGDDPNEPETYKVHISTLHSPAITGEPTPICTDCVPNLDGHTIAEGANGQPHLPNWEWLRNTLSEYGVHIERDERDIDKVKALIAESGHPYLIAKVLAEFPKDVGNQVIPTSWVEAAVKSDEPLDHSRCEHRRGEAGACHATELLPEYVRLCDLGLPGETSVNAVKKGDVLVRLGVDVAADGGDEFAVYRAVGDLVEHRHTSSGSQNADPMVVAEKVLDEIDKAQALADALGTARQVRVKIDANGLGWGVVGVLERMRKTGRHQAVIVGVMVSESPEVDDEAAAMRPYRKRDELWLTGRTLMQLDPRTGFGRLRMRVDHLCKVQLSNPQLGYNSAGYVLVESKQKMKARQVSSPDRAEAALLAIYEPVPLNAKKRRGILGGG